MKPIAVGQRHTLDFPTDESHTAANFGNAGVAVIATPVLVRFLETAALECLRQSCEEGEGSVGRFVKVRHLASAPPGTVVIAQATVTRVLGREVELALEARAGGKLLMVGSHGRAVVELAPFFAGRGLGRPTEGAPS